MGSRGVGQHALEKRIPGLGHVVSALSVGQKGTFSAEFHQFLGHGEQPRDGSDGVAPGDKRKKKDTHYFIISEEYAVLNPKKRVSAGNGRVSLDLERTRDQSGRMIVCTGCGRKNDDNALFCEGCGRKLQSRHRPGADGGEYLPLDPGIPSRFLEFIGEGIGKYVESWLYVLFLVATAIACMWENDYRALYVAAPLVGLLAWLRKI